MKLMSIQKDAQEIAASIREIVGVDIVIVDNEMERVADTFRYPYNRIDIHTRSIVGSIVLTGQSQVVENKNYFPSCMECGSRDRCEMQGLIGVPILCRGTTIGAIGVVLERHNIKRLLENVNLVLTFLGQMADLLASKLSSRANYTTLQRISSQWGDMLDTVESGVVLVDEKGTVVVHNKLFSRYFQIEGECGQGRPLSELVDHPAVAEVLHKRMDVDGQSVVIPLPHSTFYGSFHARQMWQDGSYYGALLTFRDSNGLPFGDLLLYNSHNHHETVRQLCGQSAVGKRLQKRLDAPEGWREPLLLQGSTEEALLRLAVAIHNSVEHGGKFVLLNGRGLYDARIREKPILSPGGVSDTVFLAHRGTLCVNDVFALPVYIQQWFWDYLRPGGAQSLGALRENFQTQFIFLSTRTVGEEDLPFQHPELVSLLQAHRIDIPDPLGAPQRLRTHLERLLSHYGACYAKPDLTLEPAAMELLLAFPWGPGAQGPNKAMEYLVRSCEAVITEEAVARLRERLFPSSGSVKDFERQEIERLLREGLSCDQISHILHISRATLYRRIKKYQLKPERK